VVAVVSLTKLELLVTPEVTHQKKDTRAVIQHRLRIKALEAAARVQQVLMVQYSN
jgi:hypothetical protein